ncbi:MAG TPA: carbohydrate ABC transporter permease [Chloroflexota bacterium]|nr:carbohydrate ABC transporter permease [Chloroflexota bacterium]
MTSSAAPRHASAASSLPAPASSSSAVTRALMTALPYVVLILFTLPILLLYVWLTYSSFFTRMEGLWPTGSFTLENWRFLWAPESVEQLRNKPPIIPLTINTLVFSLATTAVVLLISSMAGYALSRLNFPGRRAFLGSVLLLHSFPSVTLLIATFIVLRRLGLYDQLLGVILVKAAFELPLGIWIMKGFFDTVPWELEMAALVDGAGRITTWWRIVMPLVRPGLLALGLLAFVSGWNEFLLPFVFMPSGSQATLSLLVRSLLGEGRFVDYGVLTAVGLYYVLPILILFLFAQEQLMRIYGGGVKG